MDEVAKIQKKIDELDNKLSDVQSKVRSLYRAQWWGRAWSIFYFALIIGVAGGVFYYTKPVVEVIISASQKMNSLPVEAISSQYKAFKDLIPASKK